MYRMVYMFVNKKKNVYLAMHDFFNFFCLYTYSIQYITIHNIHMYILIFIKLLYSHYNINAFYYCKI